jgi:hypothetical protein
MINGRTSPSKAVVQGLAIELGRDAGFLKRLADEVRSNLDPKS